MINGFEYRDNLPKCPERSDSWLSPSSYECEECDNEPSEHSHDSRATNTATKTATLAMMSKPTKNS